METTAHKILVVEDSQEIAFALRKCLEDSGFHVVVAGSGGAALSLLTAEKPDLVILDLVLPGLDGLEVCRRIRQQPDTARLPVIILSVRSEMVTKVVGLELGADDYLVKPVGVSELIARVRAHLRRAASEPRSTVLQTDNLKVDLDRRTVSVAAQAVELTAKEFSLLRALLEANGRVLSREQLLEDVWDFEEGADIMTRTIDVHIRRLRSKLGAEGRRILTVRNYGYRFESSASAQAKPPQLAQ